MDGSMGTHPKVVQDRLLGSGDWSEVKKGGAA